MRISAREILFVTITVVWGISMWFIASSLKEWVATYYGLGPAQTLAWGVVGILTLLMIVRYKPHKFILG